MAANSSLNLASLDFDTLKQNFKTFLASQSVFKDYNFDGSNINVLLDVMAYNSYLNSFYLNMVASEMFLDSAQKYDSMVSHAKELNYIPSSNRSSTADISFSLETSGLSGSLTIPKETKFVGTNSNGSFTFTTDQTTSWSSSNSTYTIANLQIYEGIYFQDTYLIDYNQEAQKFIISNPDIDTSSLTVTVVEDNGQTNTNFTQKTTLFGLKSDSEIFFLQAAQNNKYEIVFGDNLFGRYPKNNALVIANYRLSKGSNADGVSSFTLAHNLDLVNNGSINPPLNINVNTNSVGGALQENIESIRYHAPRYFATQQRAVATDDFSSLILSEFGGVINDVNIYGGETLTIPQYGRVVVNVQPKSGTIVPEYIKSEISNYLLNYVSLPTRIIIGDPEYFYCKVSANVQYDSTKTTLFSQDIKSKVIQSITNFSNTNLQAFNLDLRYSKLISAVDNADLSITSNDTNIKMIKRLAPLLNYSTSYSFTYDNPAQVENIGEAGYEKGPKFYDEPVITSSSFTYIDKNGTQYPLSYIRDDNYGSLVVYTLINNTFTVLNNNLGTIDYSNGKIVINNLLTSFYNDYISLYMTLQNKDIIVNKNKILIIDPADIDVTIIQTVM